MSSLGDFEYAKIKSYFTVRHEADEMLRYDLEKGGPSNIRHGFKATFNKDYEMDHGMEILTKCTEAYQRLFNEAEGDPAELNMLQRNITKMGEKLSEKATHAQDEKIKNIFASVSEVTKSRSESDNSEYNHKAMQFPPGLPKDITRAFYEGRREEFCYKLLHSGAASPSIEARKKCYDQIIRGEIRLPENAQEELQKMVKQERIGDDNRDFLFQKGIRGKEDYNRSLNPDIDYPPSYEDLVSGRVNLTKFQSDIGKNLFETSLKKEVDDFLMRLRNQGIFLNESPVNNFKKIAQEKKDYLNYCLLNSQRNLQFLAKHSVVSRKEYESKIAKPEAASLYDSFVLGQRDIAEWEAKNGPLFQEPSRASSQSTSRASSTEPPSKKLTAEELKKQTLALLGIYKENPTAYEILGVANNGTREEVRKAYRPLLMKFHSDKIKPDDPGRQVKEEAFRWVQKAYEKIVEDREWK